MPNTMLIAEKQEEAMLSRKSWVSSIDFDFDNQEAKITVRTQTRNETAGQDISRVYVDYRVTGADFAAAAPLFLEIRNFAQTHVANRPGV